MMGMMKMMMIHSITTKQAQREIDMVGIVDRIWMDSRVFS
jgi:hypothetical protein